jgi:hypothetical protein
MAVDVDVMRSDISPTLMSPSAPRLNLTVVILSRGRQRHAACLIGLLSHAAVERYRLL